MTGIDRGPESSQGHVRMPSAWDAILAQGNPERSRVLLDLAIRAREERAAILRRAGLRVGSQPETAGR